MPQQDQKTKVQTSIEIPQQFSELLNQNKTIDIVPPPVTKRRSIFSSRQRIRLTKQLTININKGSEVTIFVLLSLTSFMIYIAQRYYSSQDDQKEEWLQNYLLWSLSGSVVIVASLITSLVYQIIPKKKRKILQLSITGLFIGLCLLCVGVAYDIDRNLQFDGGVAFWLMIVFSTGLVIYDIYNYIY